MDEWMERGRLMILNINNSSDCLKIELKHFSLNFLSEWINNYYVIFVCKYTTRLQVRVLLYLKPVFFLIISLVKCIIDICLKMYSRRKYRIWQWIFANHTKRLILRAVGHSFYCSVLTDVYLPRQCRTDWPLAI